MEGEGIGAGGGKAAGQLHRQGGIVVAQAEQIVFRLAMAQRELVLTIRKPTPEQIARANELKNGLNLIATGISTFDFTAFRITRY